MKLERLVVVGLNHMTALVGGRERLAVPKEERAAVLAELAARAGLEEAVLLCTCSRLEAYGASRDPVRSVRALREWMAARGGDGAAESLYDKVGLEALRHLFRVTAGLDSWIIGETEIQGQVRRAYLDSHGRGLTGGALNRAFQSALASGKAVRAASGIQTGINSGGGAAATLAHRLFPGGRAGRVVVFGSGEAAEAVARHLAAKNFSEIWVANRTVEKARALAEPLGGRACALGGRACALEEGLAGLTGAQAGVFSVGSARPILETRALAPLLAGRTAPLFLLDLGLPRNVAPDCASLPGVHLHDLDGLKELVRESMSKKAAAKERAEAMSSSAAADCAVEMLKSALPGSVTEPGWEAAWNAI